MPLNRDDVALLTGLSETAMRALRDTQRALLKVIIIALASHKPSELGLPFDCWTTRNLANVLIGAGVMNMNENNGHVFVIRTLREHFGKDYLSKLPFREEQRAGRKA